MPKEVDMNNLTDKVNFIPSLADLILDQPPRSLEIIEADIMVLEKEINVILKEVAG